MPQTLTLAFGKKGTDIVLPDGYDYVALDAKSALAAADQLAEIERALDSPTGSAPLAELARGKRSAAISVCDITRPAPNRKVLPPVLRRLQQAESRAIKLRF